MSAFTIPSIAEQAAIEAEMAEERERLENIKRRWDRYHGSYDDLLKKRPGQNIDYNVKVNKARIIVNTSAFFLYGRGLTFQIEEGARTDQERELEAAWRYNSRDAFLNKMAVAGGVSGHIFVKTMPPNPDEGRPYPRLNLLDSAMVYPTWDEDDIDVVNKYRIQWNGTLEINGRLRSVIKRQLIERDGADWLITDQYSLKGGLDSRNWITIDENLWPYYWPPIIGTQNLPVPERFWGASDIEDDVLSLVRAKNLNLSLWLQAQVYFAYPWTYAKGIGDDPIDLTKTVVLQGENAELGILERQSEGEAQERFNDTMDAAISEISQTPLVALGQSDKLGPESGVALEVQYMPLTMKTELKRQLQGEMLNEINRRMMQLMDLGDDVQTTIAWQNVVPKNMKEEAETALLDRELGISLDTLIEKRGYDPDAEREKRLMSEEALGEALLRAENAGMMEE